MLSENEGIVLERHRTLVSRPRRRFRACPRSVSQAFDYENEDDDEDEKQSSVHFR